MATSISSLLIACLKSFNEFLKKIRPPQEPDVRGLVAGAWEDELGRLRMWAANIGAHQVGQSSLDFRLRDASHIREQIIKLLQGLLRRLQDARDILDDDGESDGEVVSDEDDPKTEIQELQESLTTNINCLFQMSMLLRKPAQHDVYLGSKHADVAAFEPFDYNHVREKFPKADDEILRRLGKSITRRRKYLKYRERHATKLRQGINNFDPRARDFQDVQEGETAKSGIGSIISDTIATNLKQCNIDFEDKASDTGISQTSYAPTLLVGGSIAIPPPPKTSLGGVPFECPYCFYLVTIDGTRSWNKHIFQDLQPYICLSPTCTTPDKLYSTRHEWLYHSHMAHPAAIKETRGLVACILCQDEIESGKQHDRHLARHLQELALFILPCSEEDSDADEIRDAESSSSVESAHLAASYDGMKPIGAQSALTTENLASSNAKQRLKEESENEANVNAGAIADDGRLTYFQKETEENLKQLGAEHPRTLESMSKVAWRNFDLGRYEEAERILQNVFHRYEKTLGLEHQKTLFAARQLGDLYRLQSKQAEAERILQTVFNQYEKTRGPDHQITLSTAHSLGDVYRRQGKLAEAEMILKNGLNVYKNGHIPDEQMLDLIIRDLRHLYEQQGKFAEANELDLWASERAKPSS